MNHTSSPDPVHNLAAAALAYAAAGWQVFPVSTRGGRKAPLFPSPHDAPGHGCRGECGRLGHGFYDATSDPATVAAWWTRYPTALIGCRVPEHLIVLDVDPRGGGDDTFARLELERGPMPATLTCYSGRGDGGRHLYLRRPGALAGRVDTRKLRPGIDLCHHSLRYTVLPPSPHPATGKPYWWDDAAVPPAEPSAWLTEMLMPPPPRLSSPAELTSPRSSRTSATTSIAGLVRYVLRHDATPGSGRHNAVLSALVRAYRAGLPGLAIDAICNAAVRIGKPPGEVADIRAWVEAKVRTGGDA